MKMTHISSILKSDIHDILTDNAIPWNDFQSATVMITGATGLIGSLLTHTLSAANSEHKLNMRLIACCRNAEKSAALSQMTKAEFITSDIRQPLPKESLPPVLNYVFHCASITKSSDMAAKPADVMMISADGTRNMLETALEKNCRSFVYLSSMEVYGKTAQPEVSESDLGYLDLSNPRSSYPESKRYCEALCAAYAAQHGMPVKIARLALTFGARMPNGESDMRVANQFTSKAIANEDIELHTPGNSIANCCYTADAIRGLLIILLKGKTGEAYNVANPEACATIKEMAELVANNICKGRIKVISKIPQDIKKLGYAPDVGYTLNTSKLKALGWTPKHSLEQMFSRMIADRQEN